MATFKKGDMVLYHGQIVTDYVVRFLGDDFTFTVHESELSND